MLAVVHANAGRTRKIPTQYSWIRKETCVLSDDRTIEINPDVVADFRHIPFPDNHFHLVLFDPPHFRWAGDNSNLAKNYGRLPADWGGVHWGRILRVYESVEAKRHPYIQVE